MLITWIKWQLNQGRIFRHFDLFRYTDYRLGVAEQEGLKSNY